MVFCFTYRVRMTVPIEEPSIVEIASFPPLEVAVSEAELIGTWVTFKGCGYATEEAALRDGERLGTALLMMGAVRAQGVDVGFNHSTAQFSEAVHEAIKQKFGRELRTAVHGLMTFEKDTITTVAMSARGSSAINKASLEQNLAPWLGPNFDLSAPQRTCATLLNDSFFVPGSDAQFILRIAAVEALCDQPPRDKYWEVLQALKDHLATLQFPSRVKKTVSSWLDDRQRTTVAFALETKFNAILPHQYERFSELYGGRSGFLHSGARRGMLASEAEEALTIAIALLIADVSNSAPQTPADPPADVA